ncbi:MAG: hypothetical protein EHM70_23990, partial [Chloroflexota bacterium]
MDSSTSSDLKTVWFLYARKLINRLEFWLVLFGYERSKHSFGSPLYLVYVILFFSVWIFATLTLLADYASQVLALLPFASPLQNAVAAGIAAFVLIFLAELFFASRRSPFVFSEADAHLVCLTPVDRRAVALLWFLGEWLPRALLVSAGAVVLAYGLFEIEAARELSWADLPFYLVAGIRMWIVAVPLHLGLQALAWAVGAWRLHGVRERPALSWAAPGLALIVFGGWALAGAPGQAGIPSWFWPLAHPIVAGLDAGSLLAGVGIAAVYGLAGLAALWAAAPLMSLARAAQETRDQGALMAAVLTGNLDLTNELKQRERLGSGRKPASLPPQSDFLAVGWKNAVRGLRLPPAGRLAGWLGILGLSLGILLVPDPVTRLVMSLIWILLAGNALVAALRKDMGVWWLVRQLPFPATRWVLVDLVMPLMGVALAGGA